MSDINDPTHPDYIEDYDFFEVKRKERLISITDAKKKIDAAHRQEVKKKSLKWRDNGTSALQAVKSGVSGLRFLLEPHSNTKKTVIHFNNQVEFLGRKIQGTLCCRHCYPLAARVLQVSRASPWKKYRWFCNKANLIEWKSNLMHEIRSDYRDKHPFEYEYRPRYQDVRVLRHLFRSQMNLIPIDRNISEELKKKRAHYRVVTTKLKLIHDTQAACEKISHCTSRQHSNPKGCSNCGVLYIGGMLDGGTPYVQSVSRETGLVTLVTLQFEVETLIEENIVQTEIVERVEIDLFAYEEVVLGIVRVNIQAWWSFVLVWKRYKRAEKRIAKSRELHRIRRLVMMKREIDRAIREAPPLEMERYSEAYCDMLPAFYEYAHLQIALKEQRILKWAKCFRVKLVAKVDIARERKHQEYLRLLALPKPPRPILIKKFEIPEAPLLVCFRLECKMRKFLSKERYDIHMNVHYNEDAVRYATYDKNKQAKSVRDRRERKVLHRIADSRHRLQQLAYDDETSQLDSSTKNPTQSDISPTHSEDMVHVAAPELTLFPNPGAEFDDQMSQELSQLSLSSDLLQDSNYSLSNDVANTDHTGALVVRSNDNIAETHPQTTAEPGAPVVRITGFAKRKALPSGSHQELTSPPNSQPGPNNEPHHTEQQYSQVSALHNGNTVSPTKSKTSAQDVALYHQAATNVHKWASMKHDYALHGILNDCMYSLELVSKQGDVSVAQRVPLDRPLIRIGTHSSCECVVSFSGTGSSSAKKDAKVAKIHCLLYCPTHKGSTYNEATSLAELETYGGTAKAVQQANAQLTLVDNTSVYGTYVVSANGTRKVPTKITAGTVLTSGMLVCIGVCKDGPGEISATIANQACLVYRVRCLDQELS